MRILSPCSQWRPKRGANISELIVEIELLGKQSGLPDSIHPVQYFSKRLLNARKSV